MKVILMVLHLAHLTVSLMVAYLVNLMVSLTAHYLELMSVMSKVTLTDELMVQSCSQIFVFDLRLHKCHHSIELPPLTSFHPPTMLLLIPTRHRRFRRVHLFQLFPICFEPYHSDILAHILDHYHMHSFLVLL